MGESKELPKVFDLPTVNREIGDHFFSPVDVAKVNDWVLRVAAVEGEFHWHSHDDDELFIVYEGRLYIDVDGGTLTCEKGQGVVIPKDTRHCTRATERTLILLFEPASLNPKGKS